jgi:hypothetical protein
MKSTGNDTAQARKPAPRGIRLSATTDLLVFIAEKTEIVRTLWNEADDVASFWKELDDYGFTKKVDGDDEKYGERKFVGFPAGANEFRISIVRKGNAVSIDLREWYL